MKNNNNNNGSFQLNIEEEMLKTFYRNEETWGPNEQLAVAARFQ